MSLRRIHLVSSAALVLAGCNPSSCIPKLELPDAGFVSLHGTEDPLQEDLVVQGRVSMQETGQQASARSGASVRLSADRNADGTLSAAEMVETTTDSDGKYRLQLAVTRGTTVVIRFQDDGAVTVHRTLVAGPKANVRENVTLVPSMPLECAGGRCAVEDKRVSVEGLANGMGGQARIFNPTTERDQFPGAFSEATGSLLISGVFSVVELTDSNGQPISQLTTPAVLRMNLPQETWKVVKDIHAGTGAIEVPMYAFDDVAGTWKAQGEGVLEDGAGRAFVEADLAGIRAGTYQGSVVARATVNHFSAWNVDWPVDTKGCISGVILDREGNPAEGATVSTAGVTYDGHSAGVTVGPDGRFCVDVMRSDGAGEDVDQDGITGEEQRVKVRVAHRGLLYEMGEFSTPVTQGTCANGNCKDVGTLRISQDNELIPVPCSYQGTVKDKGGQALEGVSVMGWDPSLDPEMMISACFGGASAGTCQFIATTDSAGQFTLRTAILDGVSLFANRTENLGEGHTRITAGSASVRGCLGTPVDITAEVFDALQLTITVSGNTISWTPAQAAEALTVMHGGAYTWQLTSTGDGGFLPPVTVGNAPAGASAWSPDGGTPPPLASGDTVSVVAAGVSPEGYPYSGGGSISVP